MKRLVLLLSAVLALPAQAADLRIIGMTNDAFDIQDADPRIACTHRITGQFAPGDGDRMSREIGRSIESWRDQGQYGVSVVCLDSPGGAVPEALKLAALFRERGIGTRLEADARCESACALLFMAGSFHAHESGLYKWRIMHPTAKLGFHAFDLQVPSGRYDADMVNKAYALAMETLARAIEDLMQNRGFEDGEHLKPSLVAAMLRTPPDDMMYVETADQAGRWDIAVGPLKTAGLVMREMDFRRACANERAWQGDESALDVPYWDERFVTWSAETGTDTVTVIFNEMTGEGCEYGVPSGSMRSKSAPLDEARYGYLDLVEAVDPRVRLDRLPY